MKVLDLIFFLAFWSSGYGERYIKCRTLTDSFNPVHVIDDNESVILTVPRPEYTTDLFMYYYNTEETCTWRFGAGNGSFQIIFEEFNFRYSVNCNLESLKIKFPGKTLFWVLCARYDQNKSMTFCGTSYPKELQLHYTKSHYFDIVHERSWRSSENSFRIIMRKNDQLTPEISKLNVSSTPMYLYSPGYPDKYYKNQDMEWILTAKDPKKRIMLEFLLLKTEDNNTQCQNDFIQVRGDNTNFVTCGHKSKHVVALNDSSVNITFKTNGDEENEGFIIRYYTEPYPEDMSCVGKGLTLTALPDKPTEFEMVKEPSDKVCNWIIKANTSNHVIIFEVTSYSMSTISGPACIVQLIIKDTIEIGPFLKSTDAQNVNSDCSDEFPRYYQSKNRAISVYLVDIAGVSMQMNFSYYSVPVGVFDSKYAIPIGKRPSYVYYDMNDVRSDNNTILLMAESCCIDISWRSTHSNIGKYLKVYDGNSTETRYLTKNKQRSSRIISSQRFMYIVLEPVNKFSNNTPAIYRRDDPVLLKMKPTDPYDKNLKKISVPKLLSFITIDSPKSFSRYDMYHYEISASRKDTVLYIRGVVDVSDGSCESSRVIFFSKQTNETFYKWCILGYFSKKTSFSKIRFIFQFGRTTNTSFRVTVIEIPAANNLPPSHQCNSTQTIYPAVGESSSLHIANNSGNFDCEWVFKAPTGYEVQLTIQNVKISWSICASSLELYNSRDYTLENEILRHCGQSKNKIGKEYISSSGLLVLHVVSYSINPIIDVNVTYSIVRSFNVMPYQQTYIHYRSFDTSESTTYLFSKGKTYSNYRMVLEIQCKPEKNLPDTGFITFTNVIVDDKYYQKYNVTKESNCTLYGAYNTIEMDINKINADSIEIKYMLEKIGKCTSGTLTRYATANYQVIATPNMPGHYGTFCEWWIKAESGYDLALEISYSDLGTSAKRDYIYIQWGGRKYIYLQGNGVYNRTSQRDFLTVKFHSDLPLSQSGGAVIKYISRPSQSSEDKTALKIGSSVGAVVSVIFFVAVCCACKKRNNRNQNTRSSQTTVQYTPTPPQINLNLSNNTMFRIGNRPTQINFNSSDTAVSRFGNRPTQINFNSSDTTMSRIRSRSPQNDPTNTTIFILNTTNNNTLSQPPPSYSEVTSSKTVDHSSNGPTSTVIPSSNDGLPSYEISGQFEISNRSVETADTADHSSVDRSPAELPSNDGLPNYETSRQLEIHSRSVDIADHSSVDQSPYNDSL